MGGRRGARVAWSLTASLVLVACNSGDEDPASGDPRTAAVYAAVLEWVVAGEPEPTGDDLVVFVGSRSEDPIGIDVQASVVDNLGEQITVRFVDARAEAVDADLDGQPVRDDGVLVGLGAVPPDGDRVDVYVDRYHDLDDVVAWKVTLARSGDAWDVAGTPPEAEVRPLPAP